MEVEIYVAIWKEQLNEAVTNVKVQFLRNHLHFFTFFISKHCVEYL
jgi:hypothetical protein